MIGFWQEFHVNPFAYSDLSTLVTSCILPIFSSSIAFVAGLLISFFLGSRIEILRPPAQRSRAVHIGVLIWTYALFTALVYVVTYVDSERKWHALPAFAIMALCPGLLYFEFLRRWVPARLWGTAVVLVLYLPVNSFCTGKLDALKILNSVEYTEASNGTTFKLIGHISGNFFLLTPDNKTFKIVSSSGMDSFSFKAILKSK